MLVCSDYCTSIEGVKPGRNRVNNNMPVQTCKADDKGNKHGFTDNSMVYGRKKNLHLTAFGYLLHTNEYKLQNQPTCRESRPIKNK